MIRPLYSLVLIGAQPLLRRKLRRRGAAEPGYLEDVEERFGRYAGATEPGRLWLHAVSLGEMALYYAMSDVALLGGSFLPLGGQNLIEAAACGCPVVMGPHTFNFSDAAQLSEEAGAALRVASMEEGLRVAVDLARDAGARQRAVDAAERFAAAHRGAAEKTAHAVLALLAA